MPRPARIYETYPFSEVWETQRKVYLVVLDMSRRTSGRKKGIVVIKSNLPFFVLYQLPPPPPPPPPPENPPENPLPNPEEDFVGVAILETVFPKEPKELER